MFNSLSGILLLSLGVCNGGRVGNYQIVGGNDADYGELPWQVNLMDSLFGGLVEYQKCGATIINEKWILTAAHCCLSGWNLFARVGDYRKYDFDLFEVDAKIKEIYVHPDYSDDTPSMKADICLMELEKPLKFNDYVRGISLPQRPYSDEPKGTNCTISGWGVSDSINMFGPNTLQKVILPIISDEECKKVYGSRMYESMICAGIPQGGKDACQGDSGGPMVCDGCLVGVTSWGDGCGEQGVPGIYTQTSYFLEWILGIMHVPTERTSE